MRIAPHSERMRMPLSQIRRARQVAPSGQSVELFEVLIDEVSAEDWLRFRFLAPSIGKTAGRLSYVDAQDDFGHLCQTVALPYLSDANLSADVIVIALLDRPVPFGEADPEATQFIEVFRIEEGVCVLEDDW